MATLKDTDPSVWATALYAAVLDGSGCGKLLQDILPVLGAETAWISRIQYVDGVPAPAGQIEQSGFDPAVVAEYSAVWMPHDPWLAAMASQGAGVTNYDRVVPLRAVLGSMFWNEFAVRQETAICHVLASTVEIPGEIKGMLAFQRGRRRAFFDKYEERFLVALQPHLERAMLAEARLERMGVHAAMLGGGLDALHHGVALIGSDGRLVRANTILMDWIAEGNGMLLDRDGLSPLDIGARKMLRQKTSAALESSRRGRGLPDVGSFPIPRRSGGAWQAQVLPVHAGTAGLFQGVVGAVVIVFDPASRVLPSVVALMGALGLTQAEAQLALALTRGGDLAGYARKHKISVETVRSHLGNIRRKTGARRQMDIALLVAALGG